MSVFMSVCECACAFVFVCVYIWECLSVSMCVFVCMCVSMCLCGSWECCMVRLKLLHLKMRKFSCLSCLRKRFFSEDDLTFQFNVNLPGRDSQNILSRTFKIFSTFGLKTFTTKSTFLRHISLRVVVFTIKILNHFFTVLLFLMFLNASKKLWTSYKFCLRRFVNLSWFKRRMS
jgi:hypothetical protein